MLLRMRMQIGRQSGLKFVRHKQGETAGGAVSCKDSFYVVKWLRKVVLFTENIHNGAVIDNFYGKMRESVRVIRKNVLP